MKDAGIFDGDLLVVECYETAGDGDIVIAELDGEFTCKYLKTHPVKVLVSGAGAICFYQLIIQCGDCFRLKIPMRCEQKTR